MKKITIILTLSLLALVSCTKSKEVHPEIGDGNDEIVTVGIDNVRIKYIRNDIASLQKVMFNYSLADEQQFNAAEMTKKSDCFELTLNNLESDTLYSYYYEIFPFSGNTYQTSQKTFHTQYVDTVQPVPPVVVPIGAINGLFTVDSLGHKVYFSQGNLQYQASTNTWRFAEHQWDYVGEGNANISPTYEGWIDLFGWGTGGWNNGNMYYQPYDFESFWDGGLGFGYGPTDGTIYAYNLTGNYANADWGVYNAISNGGNSPNLWRTLTGYEWYYVFYERTTTSGIRYAKAKVNNVNGVILLPDDWSTNIYSLSNTNTSNARFSSNTITASKWITLESAGAVFLPAAGYRDRTSANGVGVLGYYWSASYYDDYYASDAIDVFIDDNFLDIDSVRRYNGLSVRLIQDAQ